MQNDVIKAKIIELACEEKARATASFGFLEDWREASIEITLADVLRAIAAIPKAVLPWSLKWSGNSLYFVKGDANFVAEWNLTTDYDNQTQDVKTFIGSLLGL